MDEEKPESSTESDSPQESAEASPPPTPPPPAPTEEKEEPAAGEKRVHEEVEEEEAPKPDDDTPQADGEEERPKDDKILNLNLKAAPSEKSLEPKLKKRKWGGKISTSEEESIVISSDSLKNLIAEPEPVPQPITQPQQQTEPAAEPVEEESSSAAVEMTEESTTAVAEAPPPPRHYFPEPIRSTQPESHPPRTQVRSLHEVLPKRDELLVNSEPKSPARHAVSPIVSVQNLVRPFTLGQLKDMLARFGTLVDQGFWIDRIKSKCYVTFSSEEEAQKAREVLHHSRWPASNPKTLIVDFATQEELESHIRLTEPHRLPPPPEPPASPKRSVSPPKKPAERESNSKPVLKEKPLREWDIGKVLQEPSPPSKPKPNRNKKGDHTETQLLDNLFRKTKATPFIYWLPLSEEEATKREGERKTEPSFSDRRRWPPPNNEDNPPKMREERYYRDRSRSPLPRRC